jgi:hypothetical protein
MEYGYTEIHESLAISINQTIHKRTIHKYY